VPSAFFVYFGFIGLLVNQFSKLYERPATASDRLGPGSVGGEWWLIGKMDFSAM